MGVRQPVLPLPWRGATHVSQQDIEREWQPVPAGVAGAGALVAPMLALVRGSLPARVDGETPWPLPSFVGTLAGGKGDLAARSQEILCEEMARGAHRVASCVSCKSPVNFRVYQRPAPCLPF